MRQRSAPVTGLFESVLRVMILTALCATFPGFSGDLEAGIDAVTEAQQYGIWKKRIKRLKLADPESSETMLAQAKILPETLSPAS